MLLAVAACNSIAPTPAMLPTVVLEGGESTQAPASMAGGGVVASGTIVPAQEARLAFAVSGIVNSVHVAVGDEVGAGQVLAELENTVLRVDWERAQRNLRELKSEAAIAAASQAVALAREELDKAQKKVNGLTYPRASESLIQNTEGQIELAREEVSRTSNEFRSLEGLAEDDPRRASALVAMTNAQMNLNKLIANLNWYIGKPSDIDVAIVQANFEAASAALQEAQWYRAALLGDPVPEGATGTKLAQLQAAEGELATAEARLEATRLVSPMAGTVVAIDILEGEYATPGVSLIVVHDISRYLVETTDLSERDVPRIALGQRAAVSVAALNESLMGNVTAISPLAETLGGDVVYKVTVELEQPPAELRAGMSVEVEFEASG
jgi:HlyD family secretion protein